MNARRLSVVLLVTMGFMTGLNGPVQAQGATAYRWGAFDEQSTGVSNEVDFSSAVRGLSDVTHVQAGNGSDMALDASGNVWTWGLGTDGVLGQGNTANAPRTAVEVPGLPPIAAIGEADNTDVAVSTTGSVYGWGWNEGGQLCLGNENEVNSPVQLPLTGVVAAAGGGTHMLFLLSNGTIESCGVNNSGQLGNGSFTSSNSPVTVTGLPPGTITAITAGPSTSTALINGQVWDWGKNDFGQLGNGSTANSDVPVRAELPTSASEVYQGGDDGGNGQSLALLSDGTVYGWGNDHAGQLGNGIQETIVDVPTQATVLPAGVHFTSVATGGSTSYGIDSSGNEWVWGNLVSEGAGNQPSDALTPVELLSGTTTISATADDSVTKVG